MSFNSYPAVSKKSKSTTAFANWRDKVKRKIKEKEKIEEMKGILSTEEIVNKRNTRNMKKDMIQGHINLKMDQNIGWTKQIATIKRTIKEDNKEIEDNNVVKKE